jgi:hypothetical protein
MSIGMDSLKSLSVFTSYLNHTLKLASEGIFEGEKGNRIK